MTTEPPPDDLAVIERLDTGEPAGSPEEAQARAPYERLLARIRDLDDLAPPGAWEDRAVARWSATRRRRQLGVAVGATAAVGLAAALLLRPCAATGTSRLEVTVLAALGSIRRGDPAVGDVLHARVRADRMHTDLRLYLGTRLVARCPGSDPCRRDASVVELDWKLVESGTYQIVVLSSQSDIPIPGDGAIDRDLLDARSAGAIVEIQPLTVSR